MDFRSESGQVLPFIGVLGIAILAIGVVIYWIGASTVQATSAQTAADAAALAGEQELITELNDPSSVAGSLAEGGSFDLGTVCAKASRMASLNGATVVSCQTATGSGSAPYDLQVEVRSNAQLPANQFEGDGRHAVGYARASDDDGAQASPTVTQGSTCVAGLLTGSPFHAHSGRYGFFPSSSADFTPDCEARLAGELDRMAIADQLHLTGVSGDLAHPPANPSPTETLEACAAAATVDGLSRLSAAKLAQFGLVRPVAGQLDVVSMNGSSTCTGDSSDSSTTPDGGENDNDNVHLVPWNGGPAAAVGGAGLGGIPTAETDAGQLQDACTIYSVWKGLNLNREELLIALVTATDESQMGQLLYGDGSYGLFQQSPPDWALPGVSEPAFNQEMDPELAAEMFFEGASKGTPGLEQIYPEDPSLPVWEIAQNVQRSGAGQASHGLDNYGAPTNMAEAQVFDNDVTGGKCKSQANV